MNKERLIMISRIRKMVLFILSWIASFIFTDVLLGSVSYWGINGWIFFVIFSIVVWDTISLYERELRFLDEGIESIIILIKRK